MSSSPAFTKYVHNLLKAVSRSSITPLVDYTVLSCTIRPRRVRETFPPHCRPILTAPRIFELLMAFDALRLRNIIQLIGIFSMVFSHTPPKALTNVPDCIVFHGALIVFAALQVHETRTALVTGGTDYWVSYHRFVKFPQLILACVTEQRRSQLTMDQSPAVPHCCTMCHCCRMDSDGLVDPGVVL